jgi:hypothetical protein
MKYIIEIEDAADGVSYRGQAIGNENRQEPSESKILFDFLMRAAEVYTDTKHMDNAQVQMYILAETAKRTVN